MLTFIAKFLENYIKFQYNIVMWILQKIEDIIRFEKYDFYQMIIIFKY